MTVPEEVRWPLNINMFNHLISLKRDDVEKCIGCFWREPTFFGMTNVADSASLSIALCGASNPMVLFLSTNWDAECYLLLKNQNVSYNHLSMKLFKNHEDLHIFLESFQLFFRIGTFFIGRIYPQTSHRASFKKQYY